ncbi:MAG TPA: tRNA (adenosine(37)-N6)-threonylcarbamoyltransferase complex ATPase subunit type 1 TsaE [Candidatus Limnocylindria bacterium]|nr:tRNA (adenosine(37)-N6)-threonylcarbamoyltransferase complex ATPase subunit type 1 TsaE [Candidatus Limnocylindria bacterium]
MHPSTLHASTGDSLSSDSPERTRAIGRAIGEAAGPGTVLALVGELGAGKTQLAKGVAEGLGVRSVVNSPTFVLLNEHAGRLRLYHSDAYRLDDPEDAMAAGLIDERQADGVVVIEWADRIRDWLPAERLEIAISAPSAAADVRELRWTAVGDAHRHLADRVLRDR